MVDFRRSRLKWTRPTEAYGFVMPSCNGNLKTLRMKAGFSQNRLAREANLDRATVSAAERGEDVAELTVAKLTQALSRALGTELTETHLLRRGGR
jgi:transcriptional regulator with XRE-family HTH domain